MKKELNKKGFSILELIIVAGIMVVLLTLVLINFKGFNRSSALDIEAEEVASLLRQAQVWALTGQTVGGERYNFGVKIDECSSGSCQLKLFADLDEDFVYDSAPEEAYGQGGYNLINGVYVANGDLKNNGNPVDELQVVYEAPLAKIYVNGVELTDNAQITLSHTNYSAEKNIIINAQSGQINITD